MLAAKRFMKEGWPWAFLVFLGTILRLRQYFFNRALWADEAALALNIVHRSLGDLIQPLDYGQASPLGFLFGVKIFASLFGNYDYVLRLFPLFMGLLALFLMGVLAKKYTGWAGLFALAVFAINTPLVYYSSELKQYGTDVLVALLMLILASRCLSETSRPRDFAFLGAAGMLAVWFSHPAAFVVAAVGLTLLIEKLTGRLKIPFTWLILLGLAWTLSFGLDYVVSLQHIAASDYLQGYWKKAFMPIPPWDDKRWYLETYFYLVSVTLTTTDWTLGMLTALLAVVGGISLFFRQRSSALLIGLTFFLTGLACALQKYPLKDRFMLFMAPMVLILLSEALGLLYRAARKLGPWLALVAPVLLALYLLSFPQSGLDILSQPRTQAEIKPVMAALAQNRAPGDFVYVYHTAVKSYLYYAPFYGVDPENTIYGYDTNLKKPALQHFQDDVKNLHDSGGRVWFVFSDVVDCGGCRGDMQAYYRAYLSGYGKRLQSIPSVNAGAYLYQMGNQPK